MTPLRLVEFDIHGTNPINTFEMEEWKTEDKTNPWIIPNGSPFFADPSITHVYNEKGGRLALGVDYTFEGIVPPLCEETGKNIQCFIVLSDNTLQDNKKVFVDYQSLGLYYIPRNELEEWVKGVKKGKVPIVWGTHVFGVPETLPAEDHLHSIMTEVTDWYEMTWFLNMLTNGISSRDVSVNDYITQMIPGTFAALKPPKDRQLNRLTGHDSNYANPHGADKEDVGGGNVDNFATATVAEDRAGTSSTLFSTPIGLQEMVAYVSPDMNNLMRSGVMPISQYAGNGYIPANISGSFEGLGQDTECSAFCLEDDGTLMMLSNHTDGRRKGLYYTNITNFDKFNAEAEFNGFKYAPPALGYVPDRTVMGSGGKVLMVGQGGTTTYSLCLPNNSFNPNTQVFARCNVAAIPNFDPDKAVIMHMGAYIVMAYHTVTANGTLRTEFYRVATSAITSGATVTWQALSITHTDYDGRTQSNVSGVEAAAVNLVNGKIPKFGPWTFKQPATSLKVGKRSVWFAEQAVGGSTYNLHLLAPYEITYNDGSEGERVVGIMEMWYDFNPATGYTFLKGKNDPVELDFLGNQEEKAKLWKLYEHAIPMVTPGKAPSTTLLYTGHLVTAVPNSSDGAYPTNTRVLKLEGVSTADDVAKKMFYKPSVSVDVNKVVRTRSPNILLSGTFPSALTFEPDGELYEATDPATGVRSGFFRELTGDYVIRAEMNNLVLGSLYARPLTNNIYKTNLRHEDGIIGITGSQAKLDSVGLQSGNTILSMCGYIPGAASGDYIPANPDFRAPGFSNTLVSFPRTSKKVLDVPFKKATFSAVTYWGFRQTLVDRIKTYLPADHADTPQWAFSLNVLGDESGGLFAEFNHALLTLTFVNKQTGVIRTKLLMIRFTTEAPNQSHPGAYLITGFSVLAQSPVVRCAKGTALSNTFMKHRGFIERPILNGYLNENTLSVYLMDAHTVRTTEGNFPVAMVFTYDLKNNAFINLAVGGVNLGDSIGDYASMIPKLGMTDLTVVANSAEGSSITPLPPYLNTGGAAQVFKKTVSGVVRNYAMATNYADSSWVLSIQGDVRVMLCGMTYRAPGGTIDIRDIDTAPQNKTFQLYLTISDDRPHYVLSSAMLRKANNLLRIAQVVTNASGITTITRFTPFMVGKFLLSYTRDGGTIPLSQGLPQDAGTFSILRNSELLP